MGSKRAHRKRVKGNPCPLRKWFLGKTTVGTRKYMNNKREDMILDVFHDLKEKGIYEN